MHYQKLYLKFDFLVNYIVNIYERTWCGFGLLQMLTEITTETRWTFAFLAVVGVLIATTLTGQRQRLSAFICCGENAEENMLIV